MALSQKNRTEIKMRQRLITAGISLIVLGAVLFLYNTLIFNAIIGVVCIMALHEAYSAMKFNKASLLFIVTALCAVTFLFTLYFNINLALPLAFVLFVFIALFTVINISHIDIAKVSIYVLFSLMIVALFASVYFIKSHLAVHGLIYGGLYFVMLGLGSAWGGDGAAYFAGRFLGKRKLAPIVSPNKTVEGAIGGVLGSVFVGVLVTALWRLVTGSSVVSAVLAGRSDLTLKQYLFVALVCAVCSLLGILGDLWASAIKRHSGIKDYGTLFPGHGGIMDRFDSVLLIMPFLAVILSIIE